VTADQLLQEAIIDLQKRDLTTETRRLVEEAAQLLADGRDIEARALVEKAQAIAVPGVPPKLNGSTQITPPMTADGMAQTIISRLSSRLAQDIANALNEAVEGLHRDFGAQMNEAATALEKQLGDISSRLESIADLRGRVDRLEQEVAGNAAAVQEQHRRLETSIGSLQQADEALKSSFEQITLHVSVELEKISCRLGSQEERLVVLANLVQDLSSKALSFAEQIEHQTGLVRSMQERQAQRAAALNAVLDGIAKLKEPEPLANAAEAG
jgi:vacuolar-type H+-ATPase subunit I/STV1